MRAYVEIFIESGRDLIASAEFLKQIEGVLEAYAVSEHCDIMAVVEAEDFRQIYGLVMRRIKVIKGVIGTKILPCVDLETKGSDIQAGSLPGL